MTKGEIDNNNNNNNKVNVRLSCQKLLAANRRSMESFPSQSADAQQVARRRITSGQWLKSEFITQKRQVSPYQIGAVSELQRSEDHMKEVENKWSTLKLNDDIWAKLIYFEQNCRLAKAYVSAPVLTIDGSPHGLDGFRIGLTGIDNTYRNLDSVRCLRSIGMGVKLKIDNHGNILIRRVGQAATTTSSNNTTSNNNGTNANNQCSVWVKDWPSGMKQAGSRAAETLADGCTMRELDISDTSYKLFDMRKFRLQLEKRKLISGGDNLTMMDWRQCVSIISFVHLTDGKRPSNSNLLEDPCWLMIINIIAIDMLKSSMRDRGLFHKQYRQSSTASLIQQHQSLFCADSSSSSSSSSPVHNKSKTTPAPTRTGAGEPPLRTSSSASILMPSLQHQVNQQQDSNLSTANHQLQYQHHHLSSTLASDTSSPQAGGGHLASTNERIKKLRTASNWYKLSPLRGNSSSAPYQQQYRRYQSTQQLSSGIQSKSGSNNTIYTTFNSGKLFSGGGGNTKASRNQNYPSIADTTSTSDFNFVSHSTSSVAGHHQHNNWHHQNQQAAFYPPMDLSSCNRAGSNHFRSSRADKTRVALPTCSHSSVPSLEPKSLSLSTFDLTQRRLDLRSSIKMNYDDNVLESEDTFEHHLASSQATNTTQSSFKLNSERGSITNTRRSSSAMNNRVTSDPKLVVMTGSELAGNKKQQQGSSQCSSSSSGAGGCCCDLNEKLKLNISHEHVNHNECSAMQDPVKVRDSSVGAATREATSCHQHHHLQKVSRSSIDSSSSSSGCADNDYFMSHSSSSMSSSTASNERELFSQPASSSGIVCSGNTSDEYEESRKAAPGARDVVVVVRCEGSRSSSPTTKMNAASGADQQLKEATKSQLKQKQGGAKVDRTKDKQVSSQPGRRGFKIKTIEPDGGYCCGAGLPAEYQDDADDCDCPSVEFGCDCCCTCLYDPTTNTKTATAATTTTTAQPDLPRAYENDEESIYNRLPHPAQVANKQSTTATTDTTNNNNNNSNKLTSTNKGTRDKDNGKLLSAQRRNGSNSRLSSSLSLTSPSSSAGQLHHHHHHQRKVTNDKFADVSSKTATQLHENENGKSTKELKQSNSWLERRRYSKILPKFIFSSSSSSSSSSSNRRTGEIQRDSSSSKSITQQQQKSSTLDKDGKYRLIRSTQDLLE